jgi:hypothetical protein
VQNTKLILAIIAFITEANLDQIPIWREGDRSITLVVWKGISLFFGMQRSIALLRIARSIDIESTFPWYN